MRECDQDPRRGAVGAGASPADPDPRGEPPDDASDEPPDDVVAAVAEFVDDLVDESG